MHTQTHVYTCTYTYPHAPANECIKHTDMQKNVYEFNVNLTYVITSHAKWLDLIIYPCFVKWGSQWHHHAATMCKNLSGSGSLSARNANSVFIGHFPLTGISFL